MKGCGGALSSGQNNGKNYRDSGRRKEGGTRQIWGSPKPIQSPPVSVDRALQFLPQKKQKLRGLLLLLLLAGYIHKSEETKLTTIDLKIQVVYVVTDLESFNSVLQWLNEIDCHELWQNNHWSNTLGISDVTEAYQAAIIRPSVLITKKCGKACHLRSG